MTLSSLCASYWNSFQQSILDRCRRPRPPLQVTRVPSEEVLLIIGALALQKDLSEHGLESRFLQAYGQIGHPTDPPAKRLAKVIYAVGLHIYREHFPLRYTARDSRIGF